MRFFNIKESYFKKPDIWSNVKLTEEDTNKYGFYKQGTKYYSWGSRLWYFNDSINFERSFDYGISRKTRFEFQDFLQWQESKGNSWLISTKLKHILENYMIVPHAFYHSQVKVGSCIKEYYIVHMLSMLTSINYEQSKFHLIHRGSKQVFQDFAIGEINNKHEYIEIWENFMRENPKIPSSLFAQKISFSNYYDIIRGQFPHITLVSERLKDAMEAAGITGCEYQEVTNYTIEMPPLVD